MMMPVEPDGSNVRVLHYKGIIVDGESGFLVEPGNADALAQAIERYLTDPACYAAASQKARERVRMSFTGTAVARRYADLYAAALA